MPGDRAGTSLEECLVALVAGASVNEMDLGVAFGCARGRVDVVTPKIRAIFESIRDRQIRKVLVSESNNFSFGDVSSKLVLASVVELR